MNPVSGGRPWCHQPLDYLGPGEIPDVQVSEEHPPTVAKLPGASNSRLVTELHLQAQVKQQWILLHLLTNLCRRRRRRLPSIHLHLTVQEMVGTSELVDKLANRRGQPQEEDLWRQRLFR